MNEERKTTMENFFNAIFTDEALAGQVAELAGKAGYDFTAGDLLALGAARPLSDDETAEAVGGLTRDSSGGISIQRLPLAQPNQYKIDDLVYRPDGSPMEIRILPAQPEDVIMAQEAPITSI